MKTMIYKLVRLFFNCRDETSSERVLTHTEDVEAEPLRHRFTDQLIGQTVKANMTAQTEATFCFILQESQTTYSV